jgi:hypothetical protein
LDDSLEILLLTAKIGLLLCWLPLRSINLIIAYPQLFQLTLRYWATEYILYFGFSIGFSCQADNIKYQHCSKPSPLAAINYL